MTRALKQWVGYTPAQLAREARGRPEWASFGSSMVDNYPLDMLVCYAGLSGTFIFRDSGGQSTDSAAFITFDAHTGNELVTGLGAPFS